MGMSHGNESSGKIVIFSRVLWKDIFVCVHQIKIITIAIDHQAQFQEHSCLFRNISYFHNDSWTLFRVTFILPSVLLFEYFHGQFSCFFFMSAFYHILQIKSSSYLLRRQQQTMYVTILKKTFISES